MNTQKNTTTKSEPKKHLINQCPFGGCAICGDEPVFQREVPTAGGLKTPASLESSPGVQLRAEANRREIRMGLRTVRERITLAKQSISLIVALSDRGTTYSAETVSNDLTGALASLEALLLLVGEE